MSYPQNISGLELFAAPFRSTHAFTSSPASQLQNPKAKAPQTKGTVPPPQPIKPNTAAEKPQPAQPKAAGTQIQKPGIAQPPATDKKASAVQTQQTKTTEPAQAEKPQAEKPQAENPQAPVKAQPSADAKGQPSVKE